MGDGYEVEVNEFDWQDDGGVRDDQHGVTIRHWSRAHNMSGATGYRQPPGGARVPPKLVGKKGPIAMLLNAKLPSDALQDLTRASRAVAEAS